ncbi:hypothetical protein TB1_033458 [Malus domestica]
MTSDFFRRLCSRHCRCVRDSTWKNETASRRRQDCGGSARDTAAACKTRPGRTRQSAADVKIVEADDEFDYSIRLEQFEIDGVAKEMK